MRIINKLLSSITLLLVISSSFSFCFANNAEYMWSPIEVTIPTSATVDEEIQNNNSLNLESGAAILIEQTTRSSTLCS